MALTFGDDPTLFYQCTLEKEGLRRVFWLPSSDAKPGKTIEIRPKGVQARVFPPRDKTKPDAEPPKDRPDPTYQNWKIVGILDMGLNASFVKNTRDDWALTR